MSELADLPAAQGELPRPTGIELLANILLGEDVPVRELPEPNTAGPRAALESVVLGALARRPCFVSFSGGRDSSAILAVATHVARREGLPDPVPITMRFPDEPQSEETSWQELVLEHLGLRDRVVVEVRDQVDALSESALAMVRRHGVVWPANAYMHTPVFATAAGGIVLTGVGGDELLDTRASRWVFVRARAEPPSAGAALSFGHALLPRPLRAASWAVRTDANLPWLTRRGRLRLRRALAWDASGWDSRWDVALLQWYRSRAFRAIRSLLPVLARDGGVEALNPFVEPTVLAEMHRTGGATGFASRTAAMTQLFGDLLPTKLLGRVQKAGFTRAVFGAPTRDFASTWDGSGLDHTTVDVEALRREWLQDRPDMRSMLLLHTAWLAADQGSAASS